VPAPLPAPVIRPEPAAAAPPPTPEPPGVDTLDGIERLREELTLRRPMLAAQLAAARFEMVAGELRIALPAGDEMAAQQIQRAANREALDVAVVGIFGAGTRWRLVEAAAAKAVTKAAACEAAEKRTDQAQAVAIADPRVQAVLDIFGGTLRAVGPVPDEADSEENG
jgi:hypothetical protein